MTNDTVKGLRMVPQYKETFCSQCGAGFGPGMHGYSHCDHHPGPVRDKLNALAPEMASCLRELYAMVMGECPSLLDEDSGGNARLEIAIRDIIAKLDARP